MSHTNLTNSLFYFGYSILFAFAAIKMTYTSVKYDNVTAIIGAILMVAFIIMALIEVHRSRNITPTEKIMWTTGFLFFNLITGIIYFFFARKRVIRNYKLRSPFDINRKLIQDS